MRYSYSLQGVSSIFDEAAGCHLAFQVAKHLLGYSVAFT